MRLQVIVVTAFHEYDLGLLIESVGYRTYLKPHFMGVVIADFIKLGFLMLSLLANVYWLYFVDQVKHMVLEC